MMRLGLEPTLRGNGLMGCREAEGHHWSNFKFQPNQNIHFKSFYVFLFFVLFSSKEETRWNVYPCVGLWFCRAVSFGLGCEGDYICRSGFYFISFSFKFVFSSCFSSIFFTYWTELYILHTYNVYKWIAHAHIHRYMIFQLKFWFG